MEGLHDLYINKCKEFACEPGPATTLVLSSTAGYLKLNGNSKALFHNRIQPMQVFALCEALKEDGDIVSLDLSYNALDNLAAQAIAGLIKSKPSLAVLNLTGNAIGPEGAQHLAAALSSSSCRLQALHLAGNALGEDGVMALAGALKSNTSLQALNISDVQVGIQGLVSMCSALGSSGEDEGHNTTLEHLDVGAPIIHQEQETVIQSIARMLSVNSRLRHLGLSKHKIVDSQFEVLVKYGLLRNTSIQSLDLRANKLSGFSGPWMEAMLSKCQQLTHLNLANNSLGDGGALVLAGCMPQCTWIVDLDLRSNTIGEQGLTALAQAVCRSLHVQRIMLWGNQLGPLSSRALKDAMGSITAKGMSLITDVQDYEVDGVAQIALKDEDN